MKQFFFCLFIFLFLTVSARCYAQFCAAGYLNTHQYPGAQYKDQMIETIYNVAHGTVNKEDGSTIPKQFLTLNKF